MTISCRSTLYSCHAITRSCNSLCLSTDCLNPRARTLSPAGVGLGLYPPPVAAAVTSTSASAGGGVNAAAAELTRLGDRVAAAGAPAGAPVVVPPPPPGLTPWSLPPFTAVSAAVDSLPTGGHNHRPADVRNKNLDDYVNKQRCVRKVLHKLYYNSHWGLY